MMDIPWQKALCIPNRVCMQGFAGVGKPPGPEYYLLSGRSRYSTAESGERAAEA